MGQSPVDWIVGRSEALRRVRDQLRVFSAARLPFLIIGERGTGKGLAARVAHALCGAGDAAFFALNCAAVPEALAESALFGHRRGAFTGAHRDRDGLLLAAFRARGSLLLDDIAEFPPGIQPKLLHAVEERSFYPVGSDHAVSIARTDGAGLRLFATSQPDALPRLRADLRDRLGGCVIRMPALRERHADIPVLARRRLAAHGHDVLLPGAVIAVLLAYHWPGNVRQLHTVLDRALARAGPHVTAGLLEDCIADEQTLEHLSAGSVPVPNRFPTLRELEDRHIAAALAAADGNVTAAAGLLGLKRTTLQSRLRTRRERGDPHPSMEVAHVAPFPMARARRTAGPGRQRVQ